VEFVIERLDAGDDSLADLAISAGFSDQSHLTRIFKQQTGNTPARYRSARRQLRALPGA
jgi:AraC-like DNA-binding protein